MSGTATGFVIRPVTHEDAEALRLIYNHAVHHTTATMDTEDRPIEEQSAWIRAHNGEPYPGIVAVAEGGVTVVGYGSLSPFAQRPGYRPTVENSLYVDPEWQGRGVGRILLTALIDCAAARGFQSILALITSDNHASLHLHRTLGFEEVGLLKGVGYKHGQWLDVAYLQKTLKAITSGEGESDE